MKNITFYVLLISITLLTSCSNKLTDNELSGHLLMGPFATTALSGNVVSQKFESLADVADDELVKGYKEIFALPYKPQLSEQAKAILLNDYNVKDKATTNSAISKLLEESKSEEHKAYNYACAANVANLAYASGFFTKNDVEVSEQKVLNEAKSNYSSWDKYLKDFLKGREVNFKEDPNNSQQLFEIVVDELLLKNDNSPYLKLGFASS